MEENFVKDRIFSLFHIFFRINPLTVVETLPLSKKYFLGTFSHLVSLSQMVVDDRTVLCDKNEILSKVMLKEIGDVCGSRQLLTYCVLSLR